jgi:hypothetical protein
MNFFLHFVYEIPKYFLYYPLQTLYFHGPTIMGHYGFWNGKSKEDICSQLTLMPAKTWLDFNLNKECNDLLEKKFHSFYISILFSLYIFILYNLFSYVWYRYFLWKPFIRDMKQILEFKLMQEKKLLDKDKKM